MGPSEFPGAVAKFAELQSTDRRGRLQTSCKVISSKTGPLRSSDAVPRAAFMTLVEKFHVTLTSHFSMCAVLEGIATRD